MPKLDEVKKEFENLLGTVDNPFPPEKLYKEDQVKRTGKVDGKDGKYYAEIYASCLLRRRDYLAQLGKIHDLGRQRSYKVRGRKKQLSRNTKQQQLEERFAYRLYERREDLGPLGEVFYYQVPLKKTNKDVGGGKVDLASRLGQDGPVYLIELKYGKNAESLLRAVLEIHTYYRQMTLKKFVHDFEEEIGGRSPEQVQKAVLLGPETKACDEACRLQEMPNLKALIQKLKVNVFCYAPHKVQIA